MGEYVSAKGGREGKYVGLVVYNGRVTEYR